MAGGREERKGWRNEKERYGKTGERRPDTKDEEEGNTKRAILKEEND